MSGEVLVEVDGPVGRLRLNRPAALNALTTDMCRAMLGALDHWRTEVGARVVMIDHAGGRGFCAGGDIRMLAESGAGDGTEARAFFRDEYRLNAALHGYAKATVAFMDGVTMGGGVGLALPCRYRIATENTRFAMPETAIGLFPDVGGGWYLSRLPSRIGQYLALTGARLDGAECLALGLATHFVPSDRLDALKAAIADRPDDVEAVIAEVAEPAGRAPILDRRDDIARLYAADTLEEVLAALDRDGGSWATEQAALLRTRSPQACKVSLKLLRDGAHMHDFVDEMRQEYAVACHVVQRPDFAEGVRAVIVDKDNAPRWQPATPEGVSDHMIDLIFAPLPDAEAWTPA